MAPTAPVHHHYRHALHHHPAHFRPRHHRGLRFASRRRSPAKRQHRLQTRRWTRFLPRKTLLRPYGLSRRAPSDCCAFAGRFEGPGRRSDPNSIPAEAQCWSWRAAATARRFVPGRTDAGAGPQTRAASGNTSKRRRKHHRGSATHHGRSPDVWPRRHQVTENHALDTPQNMIDSREATSRAIRAASPPITIRCAGVRVQVTDGVMEVQNAASVFGALSLVRSPRRGERAKP